MKKPKMVFFDFGGTLVFDSPCDAKAGASELLKYDKAGKATVQDFDVLWQELVSQIKRSQASDEKCSFEAPLTAIMRHLEARLGLDFSIDETQTEIIFDRYNSERRAAKHIGQLLQTLNEKGIRTGVVSNNAMSGAALKAAIEHTINYSMELVVTSADYLFCKPYPGIFLCAAALAGVDAQDCWYCGDTPEPDIDGGHSVGMLPFLYNQTFEEPVARRERNGKEYYEINSWQRLAEIVESCD